jgi:hypothetical protein
MTSLQLAQRALSFTKLPSDPANISASEAATIVGAINAGMARFYVSAPSGRKTTPISSYLRGSQSVSVGLTQGSYSVTGLTLASDTDRLGDTILVGEYKCRLAIGSSLREPWAQATGTYSGILFDDAIPLFAPIRRIEGSVIYDELYRLPFIAETPVRMDELTLPRNIPAFFSIESLGDAIGGAARAIVRLYPPPTKPSTIRFSASIEAQSFSISNLSNPISVYPSNMDIEAFIIPIIASELALTQYWQDSIPRELAIAKGKETEGFLRTYHEPTGPSMSRAITPVGF